MRFCLPGACSRPCRSTAQTWIRDGRVLYNPYAVQSRQPAPAHRRRDGTDNAEPIRSVNADHVWTAEIDQTLHSR